MKQIAALALFLVFITACVPRDGDTVKIVAEIRPEINYVTHLYTLAGLGFSDEEYSARYGGSLPRQAVDTLLKYRDLLTFGHADVEAFCSIYDRLSREGITDPAELYRKGIIEYLKED